MTYNPRRCVSSFLLENSADVYVFKWNRLCVFCNIDHVAFECMSHCTYVPVYSLCLMICLWSFFVHRIIQSCWPAEYWMNNGTHNENQLKKRIKYVWIFYARTHQILDHARALPYSSLMKISCKHRRQCQPCGGFQEELLQKQRALHTHVLDSVANMLQDD